MSEYPEHDKMQSIVAMSQPMGELLEYFEDKGYFIATWEKTEYGDERIIPVRKTITLWLAEIFDIDLVKLDAEKEIMLRKQRELNHERERSTNDADTRQNEASASR